MDDPGSERGRECLGRHSVPDHVAGRSPVDPDAHVMIVDSVLITAALQEDGERRGLGSGADAPHDEVIALPHRSDEGVPQPQVRRLEQPGLEALVLLPALQARGGRQDVTGWMGRDERHRRPPAAAEAQLVDGLLAVGIQRLAFGKEVQDRAATEGGAGRLDMESDGIPLATQAQLARGDPGVQRAEQVLESHRVEPPLLHGEVRQRAIARQAQPGGDAPPAAEGATRRLSLLVARKLDAARQGLLS